eukprot:CAMPEP_0172330022 /NCGR_PEP_ID=MMETSP1058-20130122/61177_1 /TAXON_ID=83371 /ORGANISM="Detonula confervacea, Strain CCMP 353" /LENGTH=1318 /DNA_ID=CAMNT_0013047219 /DNA_START=179 /DNA_END=4138 /DNA_ORIENTATION=-
MNSPLRTLLLATSLLLSPNNTNNVPFANAATVQSEDYYCGHSWPHAASFCEKHCATGQDSECASLSDGTQDYECYYFTGCSDRLVDAQPNDDANNAAATDGLAADSATTSTVINNFCGKSWIHAMLGCSDGCPNGYECADPLERCFAATNCDRPLESLVSELLTTLQGPDSTMDDDDATIFGQTIYDFIRSVAEEEGISLDGVELGEQQLVDRRELQQRLDHRALLGHDRYMNFEIKNVTQRRLPSGSSAIDVSMVVTGDYRPPPYLDLDVIAEDSINRNGAKVVNTLRERGERAGRDFFSRVDGIEAVRRAEVTQRPTKAPVKSPTWSPIGDPTDFPSGMPTYSPSSVPSSMPSRAHDQVIMTGSREDLQLGGMTTSSYGYIFNMRTKPDSPVILLTGMDFYTESTNDVTFELWTRMGSFMEYKGTYDGWDLIATGTTKGRGIGRYTTIPQESFTEVSIPGGGDEGGTRAFYLTLNTRELVYKLGAPDVTLSDSMAHVETPDIEVWDGEGVLFYPFPDPAQAFYYRAPRQFLGAIYYNRLPCKPFSLFGPVNELPCPEVPTGAPTVPPPTTNPTIPPPTMSPVIPPTGVPTPTPTGRPAIGQTPEPINPTELPTANPSESRMPTLAPTTVEPTMSPVVPMRANIITTLRNVPMRLMTPRENEKYIEILMMFLKRHTESSMVLDGIDLWHQGLLMMDAQEGSVVVVDAGGDGDAGDADAENNASSEGEDAAQSSQVARGTARRLSEAAAETSTITTTNPLKRKKKPEPIPQVHAMDVTLILRISFANLPIELLGNMASVAIQEHEQELLDLLHEQQAFYTFFKLMDGVASRTIDDVTYAPSPSHEQQAFYTFFKLMDGVASRTIDDVTYAPSPSPSTEAYFLAQQAEALEEVDDEEDTGVGFGVFVGLGVGFLWCCLTAISVAYLMSARGDMEEQRDMENLLMAEKANPLDDTNDDGAADAKTDDAGNVVVDPNSDLKKPKRTTTVPMGDDDLDDEITDIDEADLWDHTKNTRLAPKAREGLSLSTRDGARVVSNGALLKKAGEEEEGQQTRRKPSNRQGGMARGSMIVTSKESRAMMLDSDAKKRGTARRSMIVTSQERGAEQGGTARHHSAGARAMEKDAQRKSLTAQRKSLTSERKSLTNDAPRKSFTVDDGPSAVATAAPRSRGLTRKLSQSMVLPKKSDLSALERDLAMNDEKSRESSLSRATPQMREGGQQRAMAKSMVVKNGDIGRGGLRGSSRASLRRSSTKDKRSSDDIAGLERSAKSKGSSDNITSLGYRPKRSDTGDAANVRKSDNEIKRPSRRQAGNSAMGKSMIG